MPSNPWKGLKALFGWTVPSIMTWVSVWAPTAHAYQVADTRGGENLSSEPLPITLPNTLNAHANNIYAAHRSHSSHSSHRSHASHYSSSSGSYSSPSPITPSTTPSPSVPSPSVPSLPAPTSPPSSSPSPTAPAAPPASSPASTPSREALSNMVLRVQIALHLRHYNPGPLDGVLGPATREALRAFQQDYKLPVTGGMDTKTLDALAITIP